MSFSIEQQLRQAITLHQQNDVIAAEQAYLAILQIDPLCTDAMNLLGILYAQQQRYQEAITWFKQALQQEPQSASTHTHLAACLGHIDRIAEAMQHLEQAIALQPNYAEAYNSMGNILQKQKHFFEACNAYKKAINLKIDYIDAYINLGTVYLKLNELDEAKHAFERILRYQPHHPTAHFQLGTLAYQQNDLETAAYHYEKLPSHVDALLNLGAVLLKLDKPDVAIEKFKQILLLDPTHFLAHSNLAALYLLREELDNAIHHYGLVLAQQPEDYTAHFNLGVIFMQQRKWETAAYHLQTATQLHPNDADAYVNYATTLMKLKREAEAISFYKKALQLRPDDAIAQYRLAALTGEKAPSTAPISYVEALFDNYAAHFDHELMDSLQYKVPAEIYRQVCLYTGDRDELRMVDLGCGTGLCGHHFIPRTKYLAGVDISQKMLDIAEKKHIYDELFHSDLVDALAHWQNEIDVITAADVLVYMGDLSAVMQACYRALVTGGLFAFTTEVTHEADFILTKSGRYAHSQRYLERLAQEYGFTIQTLHQIILREQQGLPVYGWLAVFGKK